MVLVDIVNVFLLSFSLSRAKAHAHINNLAAIVYCLLVFHIVQLLGIGLNERQTDRPQKSESERKIPT